MIVYSTAILAFIAEQFDMTLAYEARSRC